MSERNEKLIESQISSLLYFRPIINIAMTGTGKNMKRFEGQNRKENMGTALSLGVHDPLWMLSRQWQYGEFQGDDAGSAIWAKVKIEHHDIHSIENNSQEENINREVAMEYVIERMNHKINLGTKIESAYYFYQLLNFSRLKKKRKRLLDKIREEFALVKNQNESNDYENPTEIVRSLKNDFNETKNIYAAAFSSKAFDGYLFFLSDISFELFKEDLEEEEWEEMKHLVASFKKWFLNTYLPSENEESYWNSERLTYEFSLKMLDNESDKVNQKYVVSDYHSGRLSWYAFDQQNVKNTEDIKNESSTEPSQKLFSFIPNLVEFPGIPNKRLWAFEDSKVSLGDFEINKNDMASPLIMRHATMYGNDWLITPLELQVGRASKVSAIIIKDVFGQQFVINQAVGSTSDQNTRYHRKWELFTIAQKDAYLKDDFSTDGKLFYPPSLLHTEEGPDIEEIQFLRDEMSNLIWAIEEKINDGTNKAMDASELAVKMENAIESLNEKNEEIYEIVEADFSYILQSSVPFNWIPFSPVKLPKDSPNYDREIRMQRATMPYFVKNKFIPIRPQSGLLRKGINEQDKVIEHKFVNEEEVLSIGTKVTINHQRTRWLEGKTYNWLGIQRQINKTQANSGLTFDSLIENQNK